MLLVTGATGYLGAALVDLLVRAGADVRATVRDPARADVLPPSVERTAADLTDEAALSRAMAGCEGVIHMAASVGHSPANTREANVAGTERVLRAAVRAGVRRYVHTSSSAAIIAPSGLVSESAPEGETALVDPYSTTKAEAERLVFAAAREGLDARIVNVVNAYGPSPRGPFSYNVLLRAAFEDRLGPLVDATVGWVLAEDVARGHLLVYEQGATGRRYILCGEVAPFSTFVNTALALAGSTRRITALPPGTSLPPDAATFARRSEVYGRLGPVVVDDPNARALGFQPRGLASGLAETVAWLRGVIPPAAVD